MKKRYIIFFILIFSITTYIILPKPDKPVLTISMQETSNNINAKLLNHFSFGLNHLISSILWIQTMIESDQTHYDKKDGNSWMFHRFNTIATLDKFFYENYLFGGQYLSVIKDDDIGADILYSKGLKIFPNDIWLNFYYGFHLIHELSNMPKGVYYLKQVLKHEDASKKIPFIVTLTASILAKANTTNEASLELLEFFYNKEKNPLLKKKYLQKMELIKKGHKP